MTKTVTDQLEELIDAMSDSEKFPTMKTLLQAAVSELEQRQLLIDEMVIHYCPEMMSDRQFQHWRENSTPMSFSYYH